MNFNRFVKVITLLSSFSPAFVKAQKNPYGEVSIASPTAASLGKYADIPVSYHTGIPQISIPLYSVKAGPLSLPIGLSYHGSGMKVIETASWVGAGWSLDAGGVITRTVMGQPDEKNTGYGMVDQYGYYTDSGYNKYLYTNNLNQQDQNWDDFLAGRKDGEPDLFFFNFGGYTGKFFFRDDHTPVLVPQQDLKIIPYLPNPGTQSIQGFTVVTPDGTKYFFGNTPGFPGTVQPVEHTNPYSDETGYQSGTAISSWYLNKVTSADAQFSINLTYSAENYGYYTLSSFPLFTTFIIAGPYQHEFRLIKNIVSGVRLNQISFPNGTVTFNPGQARTDLSDNTPGNNDYPNTSATTLGSINIASGNSFCKKYLFNYGYFTDNTTAQPDIITAMGFNMIMDKSRLRLDSVKEMSCDNLLQVPAHKFVYFTEKVPRRIALGMDHWGFYNGVTTNQTLIPTYNENDGNVITAIPGANRNAAWPAMRGGALQQITYPTGGTSTFDFEPSDSYTTSNQVLQNVQIGSSFVHLFGQGTLIQTGSFISNGNPVMFATFNNTADFQANFVVKNSSNAVVVNQFFGDNNYGGGGQNSTLPTITLPAGTYQTTLSISSGVGSNEGASVTSSQLAYVTQNTSVTIGGLRIKTITSKSSATDPRPIVTSYTYPSGGTLYSFPTYVQHLRNDLIKLTGFWHEGVGFILDPAFITGCNGGGTAYLKSGGSIKPMATTQGYHIGYPIVKVSQTGNGYSLYNYYATNFGFAPQSLDPSIQTIDTRFNACAITEPNYPAAPLPFDFRKGELYYEQHYNETGQLLKDCYYYPTYDTATQLPTPGFMVSETGSQIFGTLYNLSSPKKTRLYTAETNYTPGVGSVTTNSYTYYGSAYHNQVTRKVSSTSTGDSLISTIKYSKDFHLSAWDVSPTCEVGYANACSSCLTTYNAGVNACSVDSCKSNRYLDYRRCLTNSRNGYVNCQFTNYTGTNNNYLTQHNATRGAAGTEQKPILDLQDSNRIVPIEETDYRAASLLKSNFTRYDYAAFTAGIPYPNKTQLVNIAAPSPTFTGAVISGITLTKDSRYLDESTYTFLNGNPARVAGHDGILTMYIWDYLNTSPIAKTIFPSVDTTAFTSFESDGMGNWTVPSALRDTVNFLTGTRSYNLSSGSITKTGLTTAKKYTLSYWSKNGIYTITGATSTSKTGRVSNGWTYYEHALTTTGSTLTISGTGNIDELRLYPQGAQMSSYTYKPLVGITTMNDPNSEITFYEYDALARLKNIKDYAGNIIKNYQYNYVDPNACGPNCFILSMQTFAGTGTLSYPVGVFNVNGKFVGNATTQAQYVTTWMTDTANSHTGTLLAGPDSLHFKFTLNTGRNLPNALTGLRYYQFDMAYNIIDALRWFNAVYVDFGDGTGMKLGTSSTDSNVVRAPNTFINSYTYSNGPANPHVYWNHTYPDSTLKTITFYHNDASENMGFDNGTGPATSLTHLKNFRGYLPQNTTNLAPSNFQQATANTVSAITNWNSITSIQYFTLRTGDGLSSCQNISFAQDFMANNKNLLSIATNSYGYYWDGYEDATFKISRLKSNWNTYFTNLTSLQVTDEHWNHEDLSALIHLTNVGIAASNTFHSNISTSNPLIPIPVSVIDNVLNQIAAGAGQFFSNGNIVLNSAGTNRSSASDASFTLLKSKGWTIIINGTTL